MDVEERLARIESLLLISAKDALDIDEAAMFLGLSKSRIYHMTVDRDIPHYKKGKSLFFSKAELEKWMLSSRVMTNDELREAAGAAARPRVRFNTSK